CASAPSQTGPFKGCDGISLSGAGAFTPLSGMAFQETASLGGGEYAPGTYVVVLWGGGPADAGGTPTTSLDSVCTALVNGAYSSTTIYVAPQTVEFNLPDSLSGSFTTTIIDLTQPLDQSSAPLEDILGSVSVGGPGGTCLSGSFKAAHLVPVDPASGFPIDGGASVQLSGTFSVPYCG